MSLILIGAFDWFVLRCCRFRACPMGTRVHHGDRCGAPNLLGHQADEGRWSM